MDKIKKINVNMDVKVHNRFDVFRKDALTGEEKQISYAENILLDRLWTSSCWKGDLGYYSSSSSSVAFKYAISVGTGTGTLSPARTSLFNQLFNEPGENHQTAVGANYLKSTMSIVRNETQDNGQIYREIGCSGRNGPTGAGLMSHALLLDMNGNPITIEKTDADIITFYASWYFYVPTTSWYDGSVKLRDIQHAAFWSIIAAGGHRPINGIQLNYRNGLRSGPVRYYADEAYEYNLSLASWVWSSALKSLTFYRRLAVGEANGVGTLHGIASIDHSYLEFKRNLPFDPVPQTNPWLAESDLVGEALTSGNGIITDFLTYFPFIHDVTVYKDGVAENPANYSVIENIPNYAYCDPWFVYEPSTGLFYNPWYQTIGIATVYIYHAQHVDVSQDGTNWVTVASQGSNYGGGVKTINAAYRKYKYWRSVDDGASLSNCREFAFDTADISNYTNIRFSSPPGLVTAEVVGTGDGVEDEFTLDHAPIAGSLTMYVNGVAESHWTVNGSIVTFDPGYIPGNGLAVTADYRYTCVMTVDYTTPVIPKDTNHVFDLTFAMTFGEYTP